MVYIDDYNCIEKVRYSEAMSHISVNKCKLKVLAQKSEKVFNNVQNMADNINMKVNAAKTQMLCINPSINNDIKSYIRANETSEEIVSGDSLKILGFNFNSEPSAVFHVTGIIEKFYGKLWMLRFLKKSGFKPDQLLKVYKEVLRTSVEYNSVVYHSLVPKYISDKLESVQKQAIKII